MRVAVLRVVVLREREMSPPRPADPRLCLRPVQSVPRGCGSVEPCLRQQIGGRYPAPKPGG
ncbi:MAG: hypothetical protein ACKOJF_03695, partial [Planctomycetaceae bacterium]